MENATKIRIAGILENSKPGFSLLGGTRGAERITELLKAGARIEAALELIALSLPRWQLWRIAYDGGEWHCTLSRTRELVDWLDESAEGRHADLALALLNALVEAQQVAAWSGRLSRSAQPVDADDLLLCCDNFS